MAKTGLPIRSIAAVLLKGAKLIKFTKVFAVGKPILAFGTLSVSMFAYAIWLGPWFGVIFALLLFIHEMGHVAAMRLRGFDTPTPVFIPFLGAALFAPPFKSRDDEAFIGYGGPLLGSLASLLLFGMYFLAPKGSHLATILLATSYAGVFLNLFNLLPISPLDGGRVTQAVGSWFKYVGLLLLTGYSLTFREPVLLLIWIFVLSDLTIVPVRFRAVLSVVLTITMAAMMLRGMSTQPLIIDILDCALATGFTSLMFLQAIKRKGEPVRDTRPALTPQQRRTWLILYMSLALLLVGAIYVQYQYVPHHVG